MRKDLVRLFLIATVGVCLARNCYLDFIAGNSLGRELTESLRDPGAFQELKAIDGIYSDLPSGENALLQFKEFDAENEELAQEIYFRSCYCVYPRRIFVVPPGKIINRGSDILAAELPPDPDWLDRHRVGGIVSFAHEKDGRIGFHFIKRTLR
ncbi:MAG TPA: hypothetical protein VLK27_00680 [Chthoniobacterales bacterium]|nr:hypothetical protein [Chthoniobacterales bacterium]